MDDRTQLWNDFAAQIAVDSIRATTAAGSGHPTSSMSCAHLLAVLYADHLRTDIEIPAFPASDRFVMSKGHAAPALYAVLKAIGAIDDDQLLSLRRMGSPIQGHPAPVPELPWIDVASGSLGQGLAVGLGHGPGDAARRGAGPGLGVDGRLRDGRGLGVGGDGGRRVPRGGQPDRDRRPEPAWAARAHDARVARRTSFARRAQAFGWHAIEIDGHDVTSIDRAYAEAEATDRPTCIVARTQKGHGVSFLADHEGWHGKAVPADQEGAAIEELGGIARSA